jgi:hypothetical protein
MGRVWDLDRGKTTAALAAVLLTASLIAGGCSADDSAGGPGSTGRRDRPKEGAPVSSTTSREKTGPSRPEATLGAEPEPPGVVLRLEGDPKTAFTGICTVGGREDVLSGRVPERYAFDPQREGLTCRIQKQDRGEGRLKVILTAGGKTRSVQQTSARGRVISVSYKGG